MASDDQATPQTRRDYPAMPSRCPVCGGERWLLPAGQGKVLCRSDPGCAEAARKDGEEWQAKMDAMPPVEDAGR